MRTPIELRRELVLVGGGHAHVLALRMLAMRPLAGLRITLVSLDSHTPYSGMLPGLVAGHYRFEETHIDLARFCQWAGARFIAAEVTGIDSAAQQVRMAGRPPLHYDVLSIDTGSAPELDTVPGAREFATPVKPVHQLWQRWSELQVTLAAASTRQHIAVVGGGAGGVELALAMAHRLGAARAGYALYCGGGRILAGYNRRARTVAERALAAAGIACHTGARVVAVKEGALQLENGEWHAFDRLFWCTAAAPAPWVADSGLPTVDGGFLALRDTLQVKGHDTIFAAGDVATQVNHPRPKAGVYAVRQGPILAANLERFLLGQGLRRHRPQRRFLSLVSLGARRAVADRGPFSASGGWVWRWKDHIDRRFMARFSRLPTTMASFPVAEIPAEQPLAAPPCGGCGAKVGAESLSRVLAALAADHPGAGLPVLAEDAARLPHDQDVPTWQSIDLLRGIVADPWLMGRIAANHALSDLYACGLRPRSALAVVTVPFASAAIQACELRQLLDGALMALAAADCVLLGGHSMQGPEQAVGFVVNGSAPLPGVQPFSKRGARPGDHLVLSKPLGTGCLFAAHMQLQADGRDVQEAVTHMLQSNGDAARIAREVGIAACSDVTGFGLAGHLLEMLGEDRGARLHLGEIPLLAGAAACLEQGIVSSGHAANAAAAHYMAADPALRGRAGYRILFDPQTSGGLLFAVAPEHSRLLCEQLRQAGYGAAAVIGEVAVRDPAGPPVETVM
jgi:selenide,water dikinase